MFYTHKPLIVWKSNWKSNNFLPFHEVVEPDAHVAVIAVVIGQDQLKGDQQLRLATATLSHKELSWWKQYVVEESWKSLSFFSFKYKLCILIYGDVNCYTRPEFSTVQRTLSHKFLELSRSA